MRSLLNPIKHLLRLKRHKLYTFDIKIHVFNTSIRVPLLSLIVAWKDTMRERW